MASFRFRRRIDTGGVRHSCVAGLRVSRGIAPKNGALLLPYGRHGLRGVWHLPPYGCGPDVSNFDSIGASLGSMVDDTGRQIQLAMATAVLVAVIGFLAWVFRLGNTVNFISETVLSGFRVGAGLVIISTQLPKLFGLSARPSNRAE